MVWRDNNLPQNSVQPTFAIIQSLKDNYGMTEVGIVGFCWGGRLVQCMGLDETAAYNVGISWYGMSANPGKKITRVCFQPKRESGCNDYIAN